MDGNMRRILCPQWGVDTTKEKTCPEWDESSHLHSHTFEKLLFYPYFTMFVCNIKGIVVK